MKQAETSNNLKQDFMKRRYTIISILCFIFGGYFILSGIQEAFIISEMPEVRLRINSSFNESFPGNITANYSNEQYPDRFLKIRGARFPKYIITIFGGFILILSGFSIFRLTKKKEIEHLREEMAGIFLLPDEKRVFDILKISGGEMTQKELVSKTGLSKVKIHRILNKLENNGIIKRYPYGMTKKIIIDERISGLNGGPSKI